MTNEELYNFIDKAGKATYAGGGKREENPEREGFVEFVYEDGDLQYRDSYTGFIRSSGMEVVRQNGKVVWTSSYGGGMIEGKEELAGKTFDFLKKAMSADEGSFDSFRGPRAFTDENWEYKYTQDGDVSKFHGYEEIHYKGKIVFFHRIIGGVVKHKNS